MFMLCSLSKNEPLRRRTIMNTLDQFERLLSETAAVTALFAAGYVLLMVV